MGLGPGAWRLSLAVGNLSRHASRASSVRPSLSSHCCSRDAHLSPAAAPRPPGSQRVPCSRDVSRGLSVSLICLVSVIFLLMRFACVVLLLFWAGLSPTGCQLFSFRRKHRIRFLLSSFSGIAATVAGGACARCVRGVCAWRAPGAGRSSAFSVSAFPWK